MRRPIGVLVLTLVSCASLSARTAAALLPAAVSAKANDAWTPDAALAQPPPLQIVAAKRADSIKSPFGRHTATDKANVMLLVRVRGISEQEFDKIPEDRRHVLASDRRCELESRFHFESGDRELAFAVPRDASELQLVLGDRPPLRIRPDAGIVTELTSPLPSK